MKMTSKRGPVINTSVSPETRRKLEELIGWYGTGSEVLAVAIDRLWRDTQPQLERERELADWEASNYR